MLKITKDQFFATRFIEAREVFKGLLRVLSANGVVLPKKTQSQIIGTLVEHGIFEFQTGVRAAEAGEYDMSEILKVEDADMLEWFNKRAWCEVKRLDQNRQ